MNPRNEDKPLLRIRPVPAAHFQTEMVLSDDLSEAEIERRFRARLTQLRWERRRQEASTWNGASSVART